MKMTNEVVANSFQFSANTLAMMDVSVKNMKAGIVSGLIDLSDNSEFQDLMAAASNWANEVRMTEEDIDSAIETVRRRRKTFK